VHSTAQDPFQNVVAQHKLCGEGGTSHAAVNVHAVEGGSAAAQQGGGVEGQDGKAEVVSEGSLKLSALEFESSGEQEGILPGRCWTAGAAEESGASTFTLFRAIMQYIIRTDIFICTQCHKHYVSCSRDLPDVLLLFGCTLGFALCCSTSLVLGTI
jgi:hypothetical protein